MYRTGIKKYKKEYIYVFRQCSKIKPNILIFLAYLLLITLSSCKKIDEISQNPEIEPLKHGFKTSAAIGYCASLAHTFFNSEDLPDNVVIQSRNDNSETKTGIMLVIISESYPLPFNASTGQITIAGTWGNNGGVITALFTDIDILESKYEFKAIHTIPVIERENGDIMTFFAEEDIVLGDGSDTLLHLNITNAQINLELDRLNSPLPGNSYTAVQQNAWFTTIDQQNTLTDLYDDTYTVNGGGQIAEVTGTNGGILYHAMIDARFTFSECNLNPVSGIGFIQNIKAGAGLDLGHIFLSFHERCDGKAWVEFAAGEYLPSFHRNVNLNFQ